MKKIIKLVFLFVLLILLAFYVSAHPGKTDGSGGHTNNSTGEYHYHHGYPAHSHYDMDGDGYLDCPYSFDDRTDHDIGYNSGAINDNDFASRPSENQYVSIEPDSDYKSEEKIKFSDVLAAMLDSFAPALLISIGVSYLLQFFILPIWKDNKGCIVCLIIFVITFIVAYIWLICRACTL